MSIKLKIFVYFLFIFITVSLVGAYTFFVSQKINDYLENDLPADISAVQITSKLDTLAQIIRYEDEVLTQSARNYAFTGDKKWKDRYEESAIKLDQRINEAIAAGDNFDKEVFSSINEANLALVDMEVKSMAHVDNNDLDLAQEILNSEEYAVQNGIYKSGIDKYLSRRGADFDSATEVSTKRLEESKVELSKLINRQGLSVLIFLILSIFVLLFIIYFIFKTFMLPLGIFKATAKEVVKGNLKAEVRVKNKDEIGDFAKDFNKMTSTLRETIESVNQKVAEQTKDLAKKSADLAKQQKAILNILEDVQEEKQKAESLAAIVRDAEEPIIGKKLDGTIVSWNHGAENLYDYTANEIVGKSIKTIIPRDRWKEVDRILKTIKEGKLVEHEQTIRQKKDGTLVDVSISVSPIKDFTGQIIGASSITLDITKEKQIDRAKTEFVSLASHQLRTPLSAINWYAEMLLAGDAGKINKEQKQYLEEIYRGNQRMVELVNALLNVSRLELGTFMVEPESLLITDLAAEVIKELKPLLDKKNVTLKTQFGPKLPKLMLDRKLTTIILQNLLSNSVKYNKDNGLVDFTISTKDKFLEIKVKDTGLGVPKNQQEKIFEKLFRADNVRSTDTEGTGLGLYIVKSIVDNSGGKIWLESEENKGSTFYVHLPLSGMKAKKGDKKLS